MTSWPHARVHRIPTRDPGDVSGLDDLLRGGEVRAGEIVAILGKTEGNGCVNDFTRSYAVAMLQRCSPAISAPRLRRSPSAWRW